LRRAQVVNSMIQGSAADMVKLAMCKWDDWLSQQDQEGGGGGGRPPARLVAQIHDELLFEVVDSREVVQRVAEAVRRIMEGAATLNVPLRVNISYGSRWGSMGPEHVQGGRGGAAAGG
jgi:DNA polymerase-1